MIRFIFLSLSLFILFQHRSYADCEGKRHFVILIHGVGGNKNTFGSLEKVINHNSPCMVAKTFEYRTGTPLSTLDFAKDLHEHIARLLKSEARFNDKISLIMHSQGGIVGQLWLTHLVENQIDYLKNISSFITLSTPFWGAEAAHLTKMLFYTLPDGITNPLAPFGRQELNEMSFGSETILKMARKIEDTYQKAPHIKVLNIGGVRRTYGQVKAEDDGVVPIYSMNSERFYLKDNIKLFEKPNERAVSFSVNNSKREFILVPAEHVRLDQTGIADVPKECVDLKKCHHPIIPIVMDHLNDVKIQGRINDELSKFRVTLFINNPGGGEAEENDFSIKVEGLNEVIKIPLIERLFSYKGDAHLKGATSFTFSGVIESKNQKNIYVTLYFKNTKLQTYETPVRAGFSSFIDIDINN
jgi:hypothetical protein